MNHFTDKDREKLSRCVTLLEADAAKLSDHEARLRNLETGHVRLLTMVPLIGGALLFLFRKFFP